MRDPKAKILTLAQAAAWAQALRASGGQLAIKNGCFDLKHRGHDESLYLASREADCLLVLLNSDTSVTALKGPLRPVLGEDDRAYSLACHAGVSAVVLFDGTDCAAELTTLRPDVYVICEEYRASQNAAEAAALADCGARTVWQKRIKGLSTSALAARSKSAAQAPDKASTVVFLAECPQPHA
jgi:rfaE bifunctional protein nucleotidyltransferase chain/domain